MFPVLQRGSVRQADERARPHYGAACPSSSCGPRPTPPGSPPAAARRSCGRRSRKRAGLVRLLVRRGGTVFCTARDDGRVDLPTRPVPATDADGSGTAADLAREVLGDGASAAPVGFVRNVVTAPDDGYVWPVPLAHFTVWQAVGDPRVPGEWIDVRDPGCVLRDRHWWPLLGGRG